MSLVSTELVEDSTHNPRQIFVMSYNGENNILMEAEAAAEAQQWAAAIKAHIRYANAETEDNVIRASRRLSGPEASPGLPFVSPETISTR